MDFNDLLSKERNVLEDSPAGGSQEPGNPVTVVRSTSKAVNERYSMVR